FHTVMTPRRTWAFGQLDLRRVKNIKDQQHCTINDVVMALCAGALRRWLLEAGELPKEPIRALVPVSTRADVAAAGGNQVSAMACDIPTHIADRRARLEVMSA